LTFGCADTGYSVFPAENFTHFVSTVMVEVEVVFHYFYVLLYQQ